MISQKQRIRQDKLIKRYKELGVGPAQAEVLARCVIERRGGFGLFRACGVPMQGQREGAAKRIKKQKEGVWAMRKEVVVEVAPPVGERRVEA